MPEKEAVDIVSQYWVRVLHNRTKRKKVNFLPTSSEILIDLTDNRPQNSFSKSIKCMIKYDNLESKVLLHFKL